jgi:hypothetical protein
MKINWKHLATTKGYRSLKAAYQSDLEKKYRNKEELLKKFNWVIGRAKHYSNKSGIPISDILDAWETGRDYWWLNYYQDCNQPKLHSNSLKPLGLQGIKKYYKRNNSFESKFTRLRVLQYHKEHPKLISNKTKPRWPTCKKKVHK